MIAISDIVGPLVQAALWGCAFVAVGFVLTIIFARRG
jgi:hypothetical protein